MAPYLYCVTAFCALIGFLVLRNARRSRSGAAGAAQGSGGFMRQLSPWEEGQEIRESVKQSFMFWGGALAGILSAALTHQLDLIKTLRHVGKPLPDTYDGYFIGMLMGSWAQGQRFAVTLVLNATLQKKFDSLGKAATEKGPRTAMVISFLLSMVAAGVGEFLSNPPVVIKNYQISQGLSISEAVTTLYDEGGIERFFSGVAMGVLRKSLANGVVLQTIGPLRKSLQTLMPSTLGCGTSSSKAALSFVAGSLAGALAEVMTNHPDQVKTMMQSGMPFLEALARATRNPFRGAVWAGLRKGVIRGVNWGALEVLVQFFERVYRKYRKMASPNPKEALNHVSEFTRTTTPL